MDDNPKKGERVTPGHTVGIRVDKTLGVQMASLWPEGDCPASWKHLVPPGTSLKASRLEIQDSQ